MRKHLGREEIMERKEIYASIEDAVHSIFGKERSVCSKQYVSGGDINEASVLTLDDGTRVFVKMNTPQSLPNFEAEAEGLEAIRLTGTIGVAKALGTGRDEKSSFLLLEHISPGRQVKNFWEIFALELGAMHRKDIGDKYGFKQDNWIGSRKQKNTLCDSWIEFFRECRLRPQFEAAGHFFSVGERNRVEWLLEHLDRYLIEPERPSLVHGDLWAGNMITGNDGKGWLIDPAVYYGHSEADLAMMELFGGFSRRCFDAYRSAFELQPGYEERRDLYNLYQLLNHLNMFGTGYLGSVMQIIRRYT